MDWVPIAGMGAGICLIAASIVIVRKARAGRIDIAEEAALAAEASLAGFAAGGAIVGDDGAAALVVGNNARVAVVKRRGKKLRVREVDWRAIRITPGGVLIEIRSRRFGDALLAGVDVLDIRRLAPSAPHD